MSASGSAYEEGNLDAVPRSPLACHVCKRRKSKCDRTLPSCSTCLKSTQLCEYPGAAQKPGPKTGMTRGAKKRARSDLEANGSLSPRFLGQMRSDREAPGYDSSLNVVKGSQPYQQKQSTVRSSNGGFRNGLAHPSDASGLPSPVSTITATPSYETCERRNSTLIEIIHPSHEPAPQPSFAADQPEYENQEIDTAITKQMILGVCEALRISSDAYHDLLSGYFENMMSFSLFHWPSFDSKLRKISSQIQRHALLAAMFSYSAHFREGLSTEQHIYIPSTDYFHSIATRLVNDALEEFSDNAPPLCILQTMILTNFQQLASGVRGRAWRSLGVCIRIAYELELHLIDQKTDRNQDFTISKNVENWVLEEERRRAWWALWEFDVFASSIRRLPTAIDWLRNESWLPVDDDHWFAKKFSPSCHLVIDPHKRWKLLEKSGNKSGRAWYIVINSLMRSARLIWASSRRSPHLVKKAKGDITPSTKLAEEAENEMSAVSDAICCFAMALPLDLTYRGEFLSFKASKYAAAKNSRQNDSDKYSIHLMKQLSRFMVNHHQVFRSVGRRSEESAAKGPNQGAWSRYLDAADEIVAVIRNSSSDHIQYVNPYLASTVWLAAAAQVSSRTFGPIVANPKAVEANLDLLRLTFNRFVGFWNLSDNLQERLNTLESRLQTLISNEHGATQAGSHVETSVQEKRANQQANTPINRETPSESQRSGRIEDLTSMSSYLPQESTFSPATVPSYDPSEPLSTNSMNFGGFSMPVYEIWDAFELEELLTYGYDGNGVVGLP